MIAELGHFCLILALAVALVQALLPLAGAARGRQRWMAVAQPAARLQALLVALAFGALAWSFADNDFSVANVAANSSSELPLAYRLAATWGSHEGSMLLWALMLGGWTAAVSWRGAGLDGALHARVLGILGLVSSGILLYLLLASNPFTRLLPPPMEGRDLNALLQDPGMVAHPPMLYLGYVGFSVSFAFALAALLSGRLDADWARRSRPWTLAAWAFLTLGILLGSSWAYYELGWGGWWFWDPVENASFMPWLAGTALVHSLAATERRGAFRAWTALLAIFTFSLSLLGTFLVRSGVITSVHAFAVDPLRGVFILALLAAVTGGALLVFALCAPRGLRPVPCMLASRENFLLSNNVLLAVAAATVLLGTLYPLVLELLDLGKISVGPAYFEQVFVPLMAPAVLLMGAAPFARWREGTARELLRPLRLAAAASLLGAAVLAASLHGASLLTALGLLLACWVGASVLTHLAQRLRQPQGWRRLPGRYVGMLLAHAGVGVFIAGVTLVGSQESMRELPMRVGDSVEVGGYRFRFEGVAPATGANYEALVARVTAQHEGRLVAVLAPERRIYHSQGMPTTEAAIDAGVTRDLYVAFGEEVDTGRWAVRIYVKPFVDWIWAGCLLMMLGGLAAAWDRRVRQRSAAGAALPALAATEEARA
ncbi:heme lyase CcmF/NrfE family subunit [Ramlibacter sp. G-1-2-2]|uniref:Heme lyase CcmF/NrfE family subunit n=1 Tax=Ramlibacter agri TaxID=2728837 RepID=A0A848HDR2_9BURK|nr:heme lyase CcmF/NrfE family subunit [Ramlibacter agri]NML45698.1 heme lyase CcmF/NrfE family subunit [Ramlibacter agri]